MSDLESLQRQINGAGDDDLAIKEYLIYATEEGYRQYKEQTYRRLMVRCTQLAYWQMAFGVAFFALNVYFPFIEAPNHIVSCSLDALDIVGWLGIAYLGIYVHGLIWKHDTLSMFREVDRLRRAQERKTKFANGESNYSAPYRTPTPVTLDTDILLNLPIDLPEIPPPSEVSVPMDLLEENTSSEEDTPDEETRP